MVWKETVRVSFHIQSAQISKSELILIFALFAEIRQTNEKTLSLAAERCVWLHPHLAIHYRRIWHLARKQVAVVS